MTKVLSCGALAGQMVAFVIHNDREGTETHVHVRRDLVLRRGELTLSNGNLTLKDWHFSGLAKRAA